MIVKKGTYWVRSISLDNPDEHGQTSGDIVIAVKDNNTCVYYQEHTNSSLSNFRAATPEEEKAYKSGIRNIKDIVSNVFKVGDKVIIKKSSQFAYQGFESDGVTVRIHTITRIAEISSSKVLNIQTDYNAYTKEDLELYDFSQSIPEDENKEYNFKEGDILIGNDSASSYSVTRSRVYVRVISITDNGYINVITEEDSGPFHVNSDRFDFVKACSLVYKFKSGDKVTIADSGWGFGKEDVGKSFTIKKILFSRLHYDIPFYEFREISGEYSEKGLKDYVKPESKPLEFKPSIFKPGDIVIGNSSNNYACTSEGVICEVVRVSSKYNTMAVKLYGKFQEYTVSRDQFDIYKGTILPSSSVSVSAAKLDYVDPFDWSIPNGSKYSLAVDPYDDTMIATSMAMIAKWGEVDKKDEEFFNVPRI
jgi:hypothetical protein